MRKLLFWGPVLTASGYGEHARQLLRALLEHGNFDVSVCSVKWGETAFLQDRDDDEFVRRVRELCRKYEQEKRAGAQYDISVQVTIPNEFMRLGKVSVGVTAGIEVDRVSPAWIAKANENVDLVVVPSQHSANTFANVVYKNDQGKELRLEKPVLVAPEGFDSQLFNLDRGMDEGLGVPLDADFNFLSVGLGFDKGPEEDRKNLTGLVRLFCETFAGDPRAGLVLKTGLVNSSLLDFEAVQARIRQVKQATGCGEFPRIHLVHGRLTRAQLASLYKHPKVKAFVTTTHGEGFGLPVLEAAGCGLPVIATNWSGHLDFLHLRDGKRKFVPLDFELKEIPGSAVWDGVMERGTRWAVVKDEDVKAKLKKVLLSVEKPTEWARELAGYLATEFDERAIGKQFVAALEQFLSEKSQSGEARPEQLNPTDVRKKLREQLQIPEGKKTLLYTMPMSAGDVFISTAIVDSLHRRFPEHLIIFATDGKYGTILKGNPDIFKTIQYEQWMTNVPFLESVFDEVYTPNLAVQLNTSNWVHGGRGRLLGNELAAQCGVEFGEYKIAAEPVQDLPARYVVIHPGSGKGQWEARGFLGWRKVVKNLQRLLNMPIVQVGLEDDPTFEGVIDLRGRTTYNQLATVIQNATCLVGIDSVTMHMAAAFGVRHVSLFGSSYSTSTGPVLGKLVKRPWYHHIDTPNRMGCEKACYKYQCSVDRERPCINEIQASTVVDCVKDLIWEEELVRTPFVYEDVQPRIAGYTHILNPESQGFPFVESIRSMLGFCDEVVVVDGGSTDGSLERLAREVPDPRVKVFERKWDWNEPGMDGMQKAYGRAMVSVGQDDFLWQQDADEVVHEDDYAKVRRLAERFPRDVDLVHLPVVELWGSPSNVRTDRHSWKWRMSRNNFRVTHGINKAARVLDEKTGVTYAKRGMSDGCEYVDIMTGEYIPHRGFYSQQLEQLRQADPEAYGREMNKVFAELPSVFHYSWANLPRKIRNFKSFWNRCWSNLYRDPAPVDRFPDVQSEADVVRKAEELLFRGGEHAPAKTFRLERTNPSLMGDWFGRDSGDHRPHHDDDAATPAAPEDARIAQELQEPPQLPSDSRP